MYEALTGNDAAWILVLLRDLISFISPSRFSVHSPPVVLQLIKLKLMMTYDLLLLPRHIKSIQLTNQSDFC